jgi:hypothetical protein
VPPEVHERHAEYFYCHFVMPGMTHEQYLDEPGDVIEWNTRIHDLYREREEQDEQRRAGKR